MTIERNGVEYELTGEELAKAYRECLHSYLVDDVKSRVQEMDITEDEIDFDHAADIAESAFDANDCIWDSYWQCIDYGIQRAVDYRRDTCE